MGFVNGLSLTGAILDVVASSEQIDMAVAFWGAGALERLRLHKGAKSGTILCDARSGGCNPSTLRALIRNGFTVLDVSGLHAKVYLTSDAMVVGSANASTNGLGEEASEIDLQLEAGYFTEDQNDLNAARRWFDRTAKQGSQVTETTLREIELLWRSRPKPKPRQSFLRALESRDAGLMDSRFFAAVYRSAPEYPPEDVEQAYKETLYFDQAAYEASSTYPFFWGAENWESKLQTGDVILSLEVGRRGSVNYDGIWRVQDLLPNGLIPLQRVARPLRLSTPPADISNLRKLTTDAITDGRLLLDELVQIRDYAEAIFPS
jgi:hypothetical protein